MDVQSLFSLCLFAVFGIMVLARAAVLRKSGIRVIVFGQTDKSDFLLVPLILAIVYTVAAKTFGLPVWGVLIRPFWGGVAPGRAGLALCVLSVTGFAITLAGFGNSFRVGIDKNKPDKLVTGGMFAISRNPLYVCMLMFFCGLFLVHRNIVIAVAVVIVAAVIHRQIIREENFLAAHYGKEYVEYSKKVRRYL